MRKISIFLTFLFVTVISFSKAAWGDTTVIQSHLNAQLTWWGYIDNWVVFPDNIKEYQKIEMEFILGCGGSRCSHWDYDVDVEIGKPTGLLDSTITSLDTISQNPLQVDTLWNVFEVIEWYEVARLITPYANYMDWGQNGFNNNWTRAFYFDVTDYEPLLHDSIPIRVHYHGWDAPRGFSATVNFRFIEGTPPRRVVAIERDVFKGGNYTNFAQFDSEFMPEVELTLPQGAKSAKLNFIITGHGQDGEFTPISYKFKANGNEIMTRNLWRENCDSAVTFPQAGTWIISRCNWCPGEAVETYEHELTPFFTNNEVRIDIDLSSYVPTDNASYQVAAHVIFYDDYIRNYDVELSNIISPNRDNNFNRFNPICGTPVIEVTNRGADIINSLLIEYGVVGGASYWYEWTGSLGHLERKEIALPSFNWNGADAANPEFYARLSRPNKLIDQNMHNNYKKVSFDIVDNFTLDAGALVLRFRSNNFPQENTLTLKDRNGNVLLNRNNYPANIATDSLFLLSPGCYHFSVHDYGTDVDAGDGFQWAFSGQFGLTENTSGSIQFLSGGGAILKTLPKDFGAHYEYSFTVNQGHLSDNSIVPEPAPVMPQVDTVWFDGQLYYQIYDTVYITDNRVVYSNNLLSVDNIGKVNFYSIFPNPGNGNFTIMLEENADVEIHSISGQKVLSRKLNKGSHKFDLKLSSGVYMVFFKQKGKVTATAKLVIY